MMLVPVVMVPVPVSVQSLQQLPNASPPFMASESGKITLAPAVQEGFHKTRMCRAFQEGRCALGEACRFAHSQTQLVSMPDLTKTKLCLNFFRKKCQDPNCKFAHGHDELRSTQGLYKTGLCRGWAAGNCRFGACCRFAHGAEELQTADRVPISSPPGNWTTVDATASERTLPPLSKHQETSDSRLGKVHLGQLWSDMDNEDDLVSADIDAKDSDNGSSLATAVPESSHVRTSKDRFIDSNCLDGCSSVCSEAEVQTTLKLTGLSVTATRSSLLELVDSQGLAGEYDFVYLPADFKSIGRGLGYAFVNFVSEESALTALRLLATSAAMDVRWSDTQGLDTYIERFRNSPLMHDDVLDEAKPVVFRQGVRVAFPPPTRAITRPHMRRTRQLLRPRR